MPCALLFAALSCRTETGASLTDDPNAAVVAVVEVTPSALQLRGGDTVRLRGAVYDQFHRPMTGVALQWTTSDARVVPILRADDTSAVVRVGSAMVGGTAFVSARASGVEGRAAVNAVGGHCVLGLAFSPASVRLRATDTLRLSVQIQGGGCGLPSPEPPYLLSSSDTSIVVIEPDGATLRGVRPGGATVTARASNDSLIAVQIGVTVVPAGDLVRPFPDSVQRLFVTSSGITTRRRLVVADTGLWQQLWDEALRTHQPNPRPAVPRVDFSTEAVIVAAAGTKPSSGYSVTIDSVLARGGSSPRVVAYVTETSPGERCGFFAVLTEPADTVRIAKAELLRASVDFVETQRTTVCR